MMKLVIRFFDESMDALNQGANVNDIIKMAVRERIGRYKYTLNENIQKEYEAISSELAAELANVLGKEAF